MDYVFAHGLCQRDTTLRILDYLLTTNENVKMFEDGVTDCLFKKEFANVQNNPVVATEETTAIFHMEETTIIEEEGSVNNTNNTTADAPWSVTFNFVQRSCKLLVTLSIEEPTLRRMLRQEIRII